MKLYTELDNIKNEDALIGFEKRLIDRFGTLPEQAQGLLCAVRLRWIAQTLGIERIVLKNNKMTAYLVSNNDSIYYKSEDFGKVLNYLASNPHKCRLAEKDGKRLMSFDKIDSIDKAYLIINEMSA